MSTPGVPQWGCPWHGLVKGSRLALSSGTNMFFPQPTGSREWQAGSTALIQHPAAPAVVRSSEDAAADAAAGRQWWNKAIIAGDSLHGRQLGGWLYIDPAGAVWLVTTTLSELQAAGGICQVKLKRFGVLGGKPEEYTYNVAVPDMGQAGPAMEQASGYLALTRFHTNKTGSAAVFEVAAEFLPLTIGGANAPWGHCPCGWIEVQLSGAGAECVPVIQTLKTRAETLGAASLTPLTRLPDHWYVQEYPSEAVSRLTQSPVSGVSTRLLVSHEIVSSVESSGYDGYIVGMFYDESGRHEVTLSERAVTNYNSPAVVHSGETEFAFNDPIVGTWTDTTTFNTSLTLSFAIDGEEVCAYSYSASQNVTTVGSINGLASTATSTGTLSYSPGSTASVNGTSNPWVSPDFGYAGLGGTFTTLFVAPFTPGSIPRRMGGNAQNYQWAYGGAATSTLRLVPCRHSNTLFGMSERITNPSPAEPETVFSADLATPAGKLTASVLTYSGVLANRIIFGSWCPVTGQAVRNIDPVCWV